MGAKLCQALITCSGGAVIEGTTILSQVFFYVVSGNIKATVGNDEKKMYKGQFVYVPVGESYFLNDPEPGSQVLTFHKAYEALEGYEVPAVLFGDATNIPAPEYLGDPALRLQVLLPDHLSFDMAVNIFTYDSGGHLPMVETHIMEHGLLYLQGQGIYMLDHQWYPVKKGDSIWMAPYCQQWFTAMGKEPAVYIYYKNINRFPAMV